MFGRGGRTRTAGEREHAICRSSHKAVSADPARAAAWKTTHGLDPAAPVNAAQGDADRLIKKRQEIIDSMYQDVVAAEDNMEKADENTGSQPILKLIDQWFVRLTNLPTYPLDRLSRYEAKLWRQAYQRGICRNL